ncbi:tyrosine protein phosphatase 4 [Polychaeton citri CBS 116435]|uniref:Tyrosine protein phosphatase 4 n=1 Tax=Polychaeton citri CBS 116435 TaxID=1314669 RepID=A0A9P4QBJ3_9PEZI|nr:tyrosine protein phosphatase 4 [Polychaeton citri CBS 116435]
MENDVNKLAYPHRADAYTYRVPTPPRIVVPPPTLNSDSMPEITLSAIRDAEFLHSADYSNPVSQNALLEWTYERRRDAQMVLPYLYLGPMVAAKKEDWLRSEGITMVLSVSQKHTFSHRIMQEALRPAEALGLERHMICIAGNQELVQSFPSATATIKQHLAANHQATGNLGKVLVICESGNERSATIVAAYLMETHDDVDYIKAMQLCQAQRFCVNFDDNTKQLLQGYWEIIKARREVAAQNEIAGVISTASSNGRGGKRGLSHDTDTDADNEMGSQDDLERFGGRIFAPFVDATL